MTSSEQRAAVRAMRRKRERHDEHGRERQLREAIAANRRLAHRREGGPIGREPGRYAYLTQSHD
jgi:hypothetical protein